MIWVLAVVLSQHKETESWNKVHFKLPGSGIQLVPRNVKCWNIGNSKPGSKNNYSPDETRRPAMSKAMLEEGE